MFKRVIPAKTQVQPSNKANLIIDDDEFFMVRPTKTCGGTNQCASHLFLLSDMSFKSTNDLTQKDKLERKHCDIIELSTISYQR